MWRAESKLTGLVLCKSDVRKNVTRWCEKMGIPRSAYVLRREQAYSAH